MCFQEVVRSVLAHRGTLFGKVVVHIDHGTASSITVVASAIGTDSGVQVSEISCVMRYRRF